MLPAKSIDVFHQLRESVVRQDAMAKEKYAPDKVVKQFCRELKPYRLLRVTAVLTARDDGTQAFGTKVGDRVIPAEPYLRNPDKHTGPDENYVKDWIDLANLQLLFSGATFGLDVDNINYVLEPVTALHERRCGDGRDQETRQRLEERAGASADSPYRDSVIILFCWGPDPDCPTGQGCSDLTSPYILMPGVYRDTPLWIDGKPVYGNNHLTHELGHFMGLSHPFTGLADKLIELAGAGNPKNLPLVKGNLSEMVNVTEDDIEQRKQQAVDYIATWPYSLEQDTGGRLDMCIPDDYGIKDTPIDLGMGLPLLFGQQSCQGSYDYTFKRYPHTDLQERIDDKGDVEWWDPKPGTEPTIEDKVTINDTVRRNVMNYWNCAPLDKRFSADQVRRMHYVLDHCRAKLIGRTIDRIGCWITRFPILADLFRPRPDPGVIPRYQGWNPAQLQAYLTKVMTADQLHKLRPATSDWLIRSGNIDRLLRCGL